MKRSLLIKSRRNSLFVMARLMSVSLLGLTLNDIEKDKGGATPEEVTNKIITSLRQNIDKAVSTLGLYQAKKAMEGVAKDLKGQLEQGIGDPKKLLDGKLEGEAENIGNAVKALFCGRTAVGDRSER